jgi:hypothetical protein
MTVACAIDEVFPFPLFIDVDTVEELTTIELLLSEEFIFRKQSIIFSTIRFKGN